MRLNKVKIEIKPYPSVPESMVEVTVEGPGRRIDRAWIGGPSVSIGVSDSSRTRDDRALVLAALNEALDVLDRQMSKIEAP